MSQVPLPNSETAEALVSICLLGPGALCTTPQLKGKLETCSLSLRRAEGCSQAPGFGICHVTSSMGAQRLEEKRRACGVLTLLPWSLPGQFLGPEDGGHWEEHGAPAPGA